MNERTRLFNQLRDVLISIQDRDRMEDFLQGILTPQELDDIPMRLEIISSLKKGLPQHMLAKKLGVGIATVTRGSKEIKKGRFKYVH